MQIERFLKALLKQCERSMSNPWVMKSGKVELPALACQGAQTTVLFLVLTVKRSFYFRLKKNKSVSFACI